MPRGSLNPASEHPTDFANLTPAGVPILALSRFANPSPITSPAGRRPFCIFDARCPYPVDRRARRTCYDASHACIWRTHSTAGTTSGKLPTPDETTRLYFREGEIWWVRLGKNIGYETDGKSREFTRPVVILKKYNQYSFLALPLTTAPKPNPYRLPIGFHLPRSRRASLSAIRKRNHTPQS
jgi:hypothetical protein